MRSDVVSRTGVIILTLDAERHMPALLGAIGALNVHPRRVLFVDSSSSDRTVARAREAGHDVHVIARADFGHGRTRNEAARLCADCDFLVYLTQDAEPVGADWLERLLAPFADPAVALVYGRQLPRPEATWSERYAREFNYSSRPDRSERRDLERRGIKAVFCSNSFAAYRRDALDVVGGFPEHLPMGEDMAVALRLLERGYARVYQPDARAVHSHDYTLSQELRRYFDIGALLAMDAELRRARLAASGEGARFLRGELSGAWRHHGLVSAARVLMRAAAKYLGFALGQRYAILPVTLCRRLSMHAFFWSRG